MVLESNSGNRWHTGRTSDSYLEGPGLDTRLGRHFELSTGLKGSSEHSYEPLLLDFTWKFSWETGGKCHFVSGCWRELLSMVLSHSRELDMVAGLSICHVMGSTVATGRCLFGCTLDQERKLNMVIFFPSRWYWYWSRSQATGGTLVEHRTRIWKASGWILG
jgi:hypothetical protein